MVVIINANYYLATKLYSEGDTQFSCDPGSESGTGFEQLQRKRAHGVR
jgi:hypothetical protein